jgi:hypothetical protein
MVDLSGSSFKPTQPSEWIDFVNNKRRFKHYVSLFSRPGNITFYTVVEHYLFPPEKSANDDFHIHHIEWNGELWSAFSVPQERHSDVIQTGQQLAMRVEKYSPAMMFFGLTAMVITAPPRARDAEVKANLIKRGIPAVLANSFSGFELFPGAGFNTIHAVENDHDRLVLPLRPDEAEAMRDREIAMNITLNDGVRPPISEVAAYIYGNGRVRPSGPLHR